MPAAYILATEDPDLLRSWWVLVPAGRQVITMEEIASQVPACAGPTVLVLDVTLVDRFQGQLERCPTIAVGEPGSSVLERVRAEGVAKMVLSYDESRSRLAALFPLVEELAERNAAVKLLVERARRETVPAASPGATTQSATPWCGFEAAVQALASQGRLLEEFRRMLRHALKVSAVTFFLREGNGFAAEPNTGGCANDDSVCRLWAAAPMVLDGHDWPEDVDPVLEIGVRQRLQQWSARMLVPMHENGRLRGFFALGVRDDGRRFTQQDKDRAVALARVFCSCFEQAARLGQLTEQNDRWRLAEQHLPNVLVLGPEEPAPKHVPSQVRALIADVRTSRRTTRITPEQDRPYRATAGMVNDALGVWVYWEDASDELRDRLEKQRSGRLALLHDIALTLNHELGNALVSLTALKGQPVEGASSPVLLNAIKRDVANLEAINRHLASIPTFQEVQPEVADVRLLLREVARRTGVTLEGTGPAVLLSMVPKLVDFALESIIESLAENRPELGKRDLVLRLRASGDGDQLTAQILVKGPKLALEGIWPSPVPGDVPNHGRIGVFVAKEVVRLHRGDIRGSQTTLGAEISITLRNW